MIRRPPLVAGFLLLLAQVLAPSTTGADDTRESREALTGNWGGQREALADKGFEIALVYTGETFSNLHGGVETGSVYLDNLDLVLTLDAEKAYGWRGVTFSTYVLRNAGDDPSEKVGDAQALSNIAAPEEWQIFEAWIEVERPRVSTRVGFYDLNSEFDVVETAQLFLGSSHGIGPDFSQSGLNGPSIFPETSLGARFRFTPRERLYVQAAVLDAVSGDPGTGMNTDRSEGLLLAFESGWHGTADGRIAAGAWAYTSEFDDLLQPMGSAAHSHSWGGYLLGERRIHRDLRAFGRIGFASTEVNRFGSYVGAGLVYTGLLPGRPGDALGLAVAMAINGDDFRRTRRSMGLQVDRAETVVEFSYLIDVLPWFSLQPDVQYIIDPDTDPMLDDALAVGLRAVVTF
jgi:porin